MTTIKRELCVENFDKAWSAHKKNVEFIELCDNLAVGGTTPSYGVLQQCINKITTPITVLIRARGGDFVYTEEEIELMNMDIDLCKRLNYQSIRVGALTKDNRLNIQALQQWKQSAGTMNVSCHMAFDAVSNYDEAIDQLVDLGFDAILTKGHVVQNAPQNIEILRRLVDYSKGRITIIPGAGITYHNYQEISQETGAVIIHGTKIIE